jgi:hypothetical protein
VTLLSFSGCSAISQTVAPPDSAASDGSGWFQVADNVQVLVVFVLLLLVLFSRVWHKSNRTQAAVVNMLWIHRSAGAAVRHSSVDRSWRASIEWLVTIKAIQSATRNQSIGSWPAERGDWISINQPTKIDGLKVKRLASSAHVIRYRDAKH